MSISTSCGNYVVQTAAFYKPVDEKIDSHPLLLTVAGTALFLVDQNGIRGLGEPSMFADSGKDAAVATLAFEIAQKWRD